MITIKDLRHSYGSREALGGISFSAAPGEIILLMGPNGAGKTTLFSILSGLIRRQSGSILWKGEDVRTCWSAWKLALGVVHENLYLFDTLTIGENLLYTGSLYGLEAGELEERKNSLLSWFELENREDTRVREASFGMKKKLAAALALIHGPELLLLDEVMNGIDFRSEWNLRRLLRRLADGGRTILMSTHNLSAAGEIADRCLIIDSGRLVTDHSVSGPERSGKAIETLYAETLGVHAKTGGELPWLA